MTNGLVQHITVGVQQYTTGYGEWLYFKGKELCHYYLPPLSMGVYSEKKLPPKEKVLSFNGTPTLEELCSLGKQEVIKAASLCNGE